MATTVGEWDFEEQKWEEWLKESDLVTSAARYLTDLLTHPGGRMLVDGKRLLNLINEQHERLAGVKTSMREHGIEPNNLHRLDQITEDLSTLTVLAAVFITERNEAERLAKTDA